MVNVYSHQFCNSHPLHSSGNTRVACKHCFTNSGTQPTEDRKRNDHAHQARRVRKSKAMPVLQPHISTTVYTFSPGLDEQTERVIPYIPDIPNISDPTTTHPPKHQHVHALYNPLSSERSVGTLLYNVIAPLAYQSHQRKVGSRQFNILQFIAMHVSHLPGVITRSELHHDHNIG